MVRILEDITAPWNTKIDLYESVDTTFNTIRDGSYNHGDVVVALFQTNGRGQRGSSWSSAAAQNLMFSLMLHPEKLSAARQFQLSKCVSLAIVDTLALYGIDARIKWPNDIYVGANKIVGTLIETSVAGVNISTAVVGIGVNVNQKDFPDSLPNPTSVIIETGHEVAITELLSKLYPRLMERCTALSENDEALDKEYLSKLYLLNTPHNFADADGLLEGTILSVDSFGRLLVRHNGNEKIKTYGLKEISML